MVGQGTNQSDVMGSRKGQGVRVVSAPNRNGVRVLRVVNWYFRARHGLRTPCFSIPK